MDPELKVREIEMKAVKSFGKTKCQPSSVPGMPTHSPPAKLPFAVIGVSLCIC